MTTTPTPTHPHHELPVLYSFRRCPFAIRARLALAESGCAVDIVEVHLRNKPPELLRRSPKGTVPVLVLPSGEVLEESLDIMRWALARNDPSGWLAPDLGEMLALIGRIDGPFKQHLDRYKYANRYPGEDPLAHRAAAVAELQGLEARLGGGALFGEQLSLADIAIAPFVRQFAHTDRAFFDELPLPRLQRWLAAFLASPRFVLTMKKRPTSRPAK